MQTDRLDRQRSDSIGRTVLQTVPKNTIKVFISNLAQVHFSNIVDKNSSGDEIANVNFYAVRP